MKRHFLKVVVVGILGANLLQGALSAVCEPRVINAITQLWLQKGVPSDILSQLKDAKESYFVATTAGVFDNEDDIICLKSIQHNNSFYMEIGYSNGSITVTNEYVVQELHGDLFTPEETQHRYHIPTSAYSRMQAFYTCREDGAPGEARGLIRVLGTPSFLSADVDKVKRDFARVGIRVTKDFNLQCSDV